MEKGGLADALTAAGVKRDGALMQADELRLGRRGQVRRVLAPRGVKVVQRVQIEYRWRHLLLGVDPRRGALKWRWLERFRQDHRTPVLASWGRDAVVGDGAGAPRGTPRRARPTARVVRPPYRPERNPAERVFQEVRRRVAGRVAATRDDTQAEVEADLGDLAADPARVRRRCGWDGLRAALAALPPGAARGPAQ